MNINTNDTDDLFNKIYKKKEQEENKLKTDNKIFERCKKIKWAS